MVNMASTSSNLSIQLDFAVGWCGGMSVVMSNTGFINCTPGPQTPEHPLQLLLFYFKREEDNSSFRAIVLKKK